MEALFLAILLGCSDSMTECDEVASWRVAAVSADECAEQTLARDEVLKVDYPSVLAECRPVEESPVLVAEAS